ncbi:MAG: CO dehydrogenase/acetyl-CoA synthase complex subunit epsilon [Candidatus Heimdallarchaeota archaeon]
MSRSAPWQVGNVPGWVVARKLTGESLERLLKKATNPLLIVSKLDDFEMNVAIKFMKNLAERGNTIVFTPWAVKAFQGQDISYNAILGLVEVTNRLVKGGQIGNKNGDFDLVLFLGGLYYYQSQILSAIKNFATHLTTVSLMRYYQPNATYSFPNLKEKRWISEMESVLETLAE